MHSVSPSIRPRARNVTKMLRSPRPMLILLCTVAVLVLIAYPGAGLRPSAAAFAAGSVHQVARPGRPSGPASHAAPFVDVAGVMAPHGNHTFVTDAGTATVT